LVELGFWYTATDVAANQLGDALVPYPVHFVSGVAQYVAAMANSVQAYFFNTYGGCWTFTDGTTQAEKGNFYSIGLFGCGDHIRLTVPLTSVPQSIDLRNVLGNPNYGLVVPGCGGLPNNYLDECGNPPQGSFGPILEVNYSAGGAEGLPTYSAQVMDLLGHSVSAVMVPSGEPDFVISTSNSPPAGGTASAGSGTYSGSSVTVTRIQTPALLLRTGRSRVWR